MTISRESDERLTEPSDPLADDLLLLLDTKYRAGGMNGRTYASLVRAVDERDPNPSQRRRLAGICLDAGRRHLAAWAAAGCPASSCDETEMGACATPEHEDAERAHDYTRSARSTTHHDSMGAVANVIGVSTMVVAAGLVASVLMGFVALGFTIARNVIRSDS